jgi:hypothetical protein
MGMPLFSSTRFLDFFALSTERERPALGLGDRAAAGALTRRLASTMMSDNAWRAWVKSQELGR